MSNIKSLTGATDRGCYRGEDNKWYEADGTRYKVTKGEIPPWLEGKTLADRKKDIQAGGNTRTLFGLAKKWKTADADSEVTKNQLQKVYKMMLGATVRDIEAISKDRDVPLAVSVLAKSLLDDRTRAKTLADTQAWLYGKAPEEVNITTNTAIEITEEERAALKSVAMKKII